MGKGSKKQKHDGPRAANYYGDKPIADLTPKQRKRALKKARKRTGEKLGTGQRPTQKQRVRDRIKLNRQTRGVE